MKNTLIILATIFLAYVALTGCTRTLEVETVLGVEHLEVKKDNVLSESVNIEKYETPTQEETTRSCTSPGVCCKCGFTMSMEHECSCGMWRNCPGTQSVKYEHQTYTYRKHFKVKEEKGEKNYSSPLYVGKTTKTLTAGNCN